MRDARVEDRGGGPEVQLGEDADVYVEVSVEDRGGSRRRFS
jgi:hypothetical protein